MTISSTVSLNLEMVGNTRSSPMMPNLHLHLRLETDLSRGLEPERTRQMRHPGRCEQRGTVSWTILTAVGQNREHRRQQRREICHLRLFHNPLPPNISAANHGAHAHQDASRVLFNERSNRLEPYGHAHAPGQGAFTAKRPGHPEGSSPVESRNGRYGHPVVVLQKPGANDPRARRYSGSSSSNFNVGSSNGPINDRSRRDVPPPSPRMTRDPPPSHH